MSLLLRVVVSASVTALVLAGAGKTFEIWRFGTTEAAGTSRLEAAVRRSVAAVATQVEAVAARAAADSATLGAAATTSDPSRTSLAALFARLEALTDPAGDVPVTVTVYVPAASGAYRPLAWSDGPAGDVAPALLNGPATVVATPGATGLRLVAVHPMDVNGRRLGTVAAEAILTADAREGTPLLVTPLGPVTLVPTYAAGALPAAHAFLIDRPRLEVHFGPDEISQARVALQRRTLAVATLPLVGALLVCTGPFIARRRSAAALALLAGAARLLAWSLTRLAVPGLATGAVWAAAAVGGVAILASDIWWRPHRRRTPGDAPARFLGEQLLVGVGLGAAVGLTWFLLTQRITARELPAWHSALFPFDLAGLVGVWTVLLVTLAIGWAAAAALAVGRERWRVSPSPAWTAVTLVAWFGGAALVAAVRAPWPAIPIGAALAMAAPLVVFAWRGADVRRAYRRATQATRLLMGLLAFVLPLVGAYPLMAAAVDHASMDVIERTYAPQAARQSEELQRVLNVTRDEIDHLTLPALPPARPAEPLDSQAAFLVWNQTILKRARVTSDVELYGPDRALISRFALNFPEYIARSTAQTWAGEGCAWEVFGEVTRFGSSNSTMLHAQRGICDASGALAGAIVVHVAPTDYEALPFVAATRPLADRLGSGATTEQPEGPVGLQLVVYGWSLRPLFATTEGIAWTIDDALFRRIYDDGESFWTTRDATRRSYRVFLQQNRTGIFALGYPAPTLLDHAARLAEILAVASLIFVGAQTAALVYVPFMRRTRAPLRVLIGEVGTSFYRKLFLFFVLVAVGPVLVFALAFGGFMQSRFRDDIQGEAASVVAVARRVFDQIAGANPSVTERPTDDVMVWIRQVIEEDVNVFDGPTLVATSQRDLVNSGLLPGRTPATVYRKIALEQLPSFVTEDQQYLVAATPVPGLGPNAVLSVPLAPRQREIEREIDELNRGVLVGSVLVVLLAALLGASLAGRVADPVARLTHATRRIAAGELDVRIAADTADELRQLVDDFNTMTARLVAQRAELARAHELKAWHEMARQVAHEIKNPLTPIQLAAEHLQRVHADRGRPLDPTLDQCVATILTQVRLLRQIASEFATFASEPVSRPEVLALAPLVESVVAAYRPGLTGRISFETRIPDAIQVRSDRTLLVRALTNLIENAIQAMPDGGQLRVTGVANPTDVRLTIADTGVGMDRETMARAFEPFFSTKTGGSGLGLANAKRSIEREGGRVALTSAPGEGTTVTVTWPPVADRPEDPPPDPPDAPGTSQAPSR